MSNIAEVTDAASGFGTIYTMSPGDVFGGSLAGDADAVDTILIDIEAGVDYSISVTGLIGGLNTGFFGVSNFDAGLNFQFVNYATGFTAGTMPATVVSTATSHTLTFTAPVTGSYALQVADNGDAAAGAYTVSLFEGGLPMSVATPLDDDFIGGPDGSTVNLLTGNDTFTGLGGDDSVLGNDGNDIMDTGFGNDYLSGGAGEDTLFGGHGDDTMSGDADNDTMYGGEGDDDMQGGAGVDVIQGQGGNDDMSGDQGRDTLHGGDGDDTLLGGADNDLVRGDDGNDSLRGDAGNDLVNGGADNDSLFGGAGDDTLIGGDGDDFIFGQSGFDRMTGGEGADVFMADRVSADIVRDFEDGVDMIQLSHLALASTYTITSNNRGDAVIQVDGSDALVLRNISALDITAADIDAGHLVDTDWLLPA